MRIATTCWHCLWVNGLGYSNSVGEVVMTRDGKVYPVRAVLAANLTNDVAIVQVEGDGFTPLPVASQAPIGSPVWVISHPGGVFYTLTTGIVSHYADWSSMMADWTTAGHTVWMVITADYANGSSGAPVLNQYGAVVGVACSADPMFLEPGHSQLMTERLCAPSAALLKLIQEE